MQMRGWVSVAQPVFHRAVAPISTNWSMPSALIPPHIEALRWSVIGLSPTMVAPLAAGDTGWVSLGNRPSRSGAPGTAFTSGLSAGLRRDTIARTGHSAADPIRLKRKKARMNRTF